MGKARQERELTLLARIDEQTIKRSIARINDLSASYNDLSKTQVQQEHASIESAAGLDRFDGESRQVINTLRQQIAVLKLDIQAQKDRVGIIRQQTGAIEDQTRAQDKLNKEQKQGGMSFAERAGDVSTGVSALAQLAPGPAGDIARVVADLSGFVEQIPRLSGALQGAQVASLGASGGIASLLTTLGPVTVVAIAAGIAISKFVKDMENLNKNLDSAIAAQRKYYDVIQTGTVESIQEEIRVRQQGQAAINSTLADLQEGYDQQSFANQQLANVFLGTGKRIKELQLESQAAEFEISALNRALENTEVKARQAASELEEFQAERDRISQGMVAEIKREAEFRQHAWDLANEGNREALKSERESNKSRQAAIEAQIAELETLNSDNKVYIQALAELRVELGFLKSEEKELTEQISGPLLRAREAEIATAERQTEAMNKFNDLAQARMEFNIALAEQEKRVEAERAEIAQRATDAIAAAGQKLVGDIAKIEAELARAEAESKRKLDQAIAEAESEAVEREQEIREESAKRINDLEERYARQRQQIIEQYNFDANTAIQNRDAVALDTAKRTRDKALKDAKRDFESGVKEEKRALKERLDAQKKSNQERIADLRKSYEQEQRDRRAAAEQRIADLRAANQAEIDAIRRREQEALGVLDERNRQEIEKIRQHLTEVLDKYGVFYGNLETTTNTELGLLTDRWAGYYGDLSGMLDSFIADNTVWDQPIEAAARGIANFRNGDLLVGEEGPELMRVRNGIVSVKNNRDTVRTLAGMAGVIRSQVRTNNITNQRVLNVNAGAFSANLSGSDPGRMVRELERRMYRRLPNILADILERN